MTQPASSNLPADPSLVLQPAPHVCSGLHKTRLLVGEGNFSFAKALIQKHDEKHHHDLANSLGLKIIATELRQDLLCQTCRMSNKLALMTISPASQNNDKPDLCVKCTQTIQRIENLEAHGVVVKLGVDCTRLHEIAEFKDKKFSRIHWNCPHVGEDGSADFKKQEVPPIITNFFKSCRQVQNAHDQIHITLAQPPGKTDFYQGYVYDIVRAATLSGYTLIKKRKFDQNRYPGYQHVMTGTNDSASVTEKGMREFVFKKLSNEICVAEMAKVKKQNDNKVPIEYLAANFAALSDKEYTLKGVTYYKTPRMYLACSSDEDSSDYEQPFA